MPARTTKVAFRIEAAAGGRQEARRSAARSCRACRLVRRRSRGAAVAKLASLGLLFGSLEASPSVPVTTARRWRSDRLDREGFVAPAQRSGASGAAEGASPRDTAIGAVVLGYQWFPDWGVVAAYAGPEGTRRWCRARLRPRPAAPLRPAPARRGLGPADRRHPARTPPLSPARPATSVWGRGSAWGYGCWGAYLGPEVGPLRATGPATGNGISGCTPPISPSAASAFASRPACTRRRAGAPAPMSASPSGRPGRPADGAADRAVAAEVQGQRPGRARRAVEEAAPHPRRISARAPASMRARVR